jgi:hypothetical protein
MRRCQRRSDPAKRIAGAEVPTFLHSVLREGEDRTGISDAAQ